MSNLYKDAIADARKLREIAEQNEKNRIIDAVTPQLRRLIEHELNEGDEEFVDDMEDLDGLVEPSADLDMLDDEIEDLGTAAPEAMSPIPEPIDVDSDGFSSVELCPFPKFHKYEAAFSLLFSKSNT